MVLDEDDIEEYLSEYEDILRFVNENCKKKSELFKELANIFEGSYNKWKRIENKEENNNAIN